MMISYSQNGEDVVLERAFRGQTTGFYIDVGAWDPDLDSVTKHFYLKGWSGINIEPTDHFFERLNEKRSRDINLKVAVGSEAGTAEFIQYGDLGLSGLAKTVHTGIIQETEFQKLAKSIQVELKPLHEITREYVHKQVDFLKIDVEGAEKAVIEGGEWRAFRPRVIVIEAVVPISYEPAWFEWEHLLFQRGYCFALFDGLNRFYYRAEEASLYAPLSIPANATDNFQTYQMQRLQRKVAEMNTETSHAAE